MRLVRYAFIAMLVSVAVAAEAPRIAGLSPTSGRIGAQVTIAGAGFGSAQGASTVTFNGKQANAIKWNESTIVAAVPIGADSGEVVVTVTGMKSNTASFTVVPAR